MKRYVKCNDIYDLDKSKFNSEELRVIQKGLDNGLDVSWYADRKYDASQMKQIYTGLKNGLDVSWYADPTYNFMQMGMIREGLENGLDVSIYADPRYTDNQMLHIYDGLEDGLDVSWYADPKYNHHQMNEIYKGLKNGLDVSIYADPKYNDDQMKAIRTGLEAGLTDAHEILNRYENSKRNIKKRWPSKDEWYDIDSDEQFDNMWSSYLSDPEDEVNKELQIFPEPSTQGGMGGMFIFDESGNDNESFSIDFQYWCDRELEMAASSKSAEQYKEKYRTFIQGLIDEEGWA